MDNLVGELRLRCGDVDESTHDLEESLVFRLVNVSRRIVLGDLVQQDRCHRYGARAIRVRFALAQVLQSCLPGLD